MRVVAILVLDDFEVSRLAEACYRFSPQVAVGDHVVFLEIGACQKLYSEQNILKRLQIIAQRFAVPVKMAVADDMSSAKAFALFDCTTKQQLPIEAIDSYFDPFQKVASLLPIVCSLQRLGIHTVGDFLKLPASALPAHLGRAGVVVRQNIDEASRRVWPRFVPAPTFLEGSEVDEDLRIQELEPLLFLLKALVDRVLLRVRGLQLLASVARLRLKQEAYSHVTHPVREWIFEFAFPLASARNILALIRERLSYDLQRQPLQSELRNIEFEVLKTVIGQGRQTDFFSKKEEEQENFNSIVARLSDKLGRANVFLASPLESYWPEYSWCKSLSSVARVAMPLPLRPTRVLKQPYRLEWVEGELLCRARRWKVKKWLGPERLAGAWWRQDQERDYYRVTVDSGEELWVFFQAATNEYFLHGLFD